jgi:hypothetical protein
MASPFQHLFYFICIHFFPGSLLVGLLAYGREGQLYGGMSFVKIEYKKIVGLM